MAQGSPCSSSSRRRHLILRRSQEVAVIWLAPSVSSMADSFVQWAVRQASRLLSRSSGSREWPSRCSRLIFTGATSGPSSSLCLRLRLRLALLHFTSFGLTLLRDCAGQQCPSPTASLRARRAHTQLVSSARRAEPMPPSRLGPQSRRRIFSQASPPLRYVDVPLASRALRFNCNCNCKSPQGKGARMHSHVPAPPRRQLPPVHTICTHLYRARPCLAPKTSALLH